MKKYIEELLEKLTLSEKIDMVHGTALFHTGGVERLGIPPLVMSDGPSGVRYDFHDHKWILINQNYDMISYLPCNSALSATWNRECAYINGKVLGSEARGRGKDVILAPGINIKRTPLCGRNFEYMSEDPYLVSEMVAPMVQGIQESDVAACVKHFAVNCQETDRMCVDTIVDERTLYEIYYPGYISAIKNGNTYSIMSAYNKLNGEFCCMSKSLLNDTLKDRWSFDGAVISDWGGVHDTRLAAEAEIDVEMDIHYRFDEHYMAKPLQDMIEAGEIDEELLDKKIRNILALMYRIKMIGPEAEKRSPGAYNLPSHQESMRRVAEESIVLLKNEDKKLPLDTKKLKNIAVIGENAIHVHSNGGGSAEIKALYEICPLMGIMMEAGGNVKVTCAQGYYVPTKEERADQESWQLLSTTKQHQPHEPGDEERLYEVEKAIRSKRRELKEEALELAKNADEVIFVGGLNHDIDSEGKDRKNLKLPYEQDALIEELLKIRPDMVICFVAGSPVAMPWADKAKAIVWSYYSGMEGGRALAKVLFGRVNPSGHISETFLRDENDCLPVKRGHFGKEGTALHDEGVFVGYRQYDSDGVDVLYPFGHGLSYTEYKYEDMKLSLDDNGNIDVSFSVENTGDMAGFAVAELYTGPADKVAGRPVHELKAFEKIYLEPREKKEVTVKLYPKAFSYYSTKDKGYVTKPGRYIIEIGESSRDIRLKGEVGFTMEVQTYIF